MAKIKITGIKGMNDMLPEEAGIWEKFEDTARCVAASYGYRQIRTPILEATGLFPAAWVKPPTSLKRRCIPLPVR